MVTFIFKGQPLGQARAARLLLGGAGQRAPGVQQNDGFGATWRNNKRIIILGNVFLLMLLSPALMLISPYLPSPSVFRSSSTSSPPPNNSTTYIQQHSVRTEPYPLRENLDSLFRSLANVVEDVYFLEQSPCQTHQLPHWQQRQSHDPFRGPPPNSSDKHSDSDGNNNVETICGTPPLYNGTLLFTASQLIMSMYGDISKQADRYVRAYQDDHYREATDSFYRELDSRERLDDPWILQYVDRVHAGLHPILLILADGHPDRYHNLAPPGFAALQNAWRTAFSSSALVNSEGDASVDDDNGKLLTATAGLMLSEHSLWAKRVGIALEHALDKADEELKRPLPPGLEFILDPNFSQPETLSGGEKGFEEEEEGGQRRKSEAGGDGEEEEEMKKKTTFGENYQQRSDDQQNDQDAKGNEKDPWSKLNPFLDKLQVPSRPRWQAAREWNSWTLEIILRVYFARTGVPPLSSSSPSTTKIWYDRQPSMFRELLFSAKRTTRVLRGAEAGLQRFEDLTLAWFAAQDIINTTKTAAEASEASPNENNKAKGRWWSRNPLARGRNYGREDGSSSSTGDAEDEEEEEEEEEGHDQDEWPYGDSSRTRSKTRSKTRTRRKWEELRRYRLHAGLAAVQADQLSHRVQGVLEQWQKLGDELAGLVDGNMKKVDTEVLSVVEPGEASDDQGRQQQRVVTLGVTTTVYTLPSSIEDLIVIFKNISLAADEFYRALGVHVHLLQDEYPRPEWWR